MTLTDQELWHILQVTPPAAKSQPKARPWEREQERDDSPVLAQVWIEWAKAEVLSIAAVSTSRVHPGQCIGYLARLVRVLDVLAECGITQARMRRENAIAMYEEIYLNELLNNGLAACDYSADNVDHTLFLATRDGLLTEHEFDDWHPGMESGSGRRSYYGLTFKGKKEAEKASVMPPVWDDTSEDVGPDCDVVEVGAAVETPEVDGTASASASVTEGVSGSSKTIEIDGRPRAVVGHSSEPGKVLRLLLDGNEVAELVFLVACDEGATPSKALMAEDFFGWRMPPQKLTSCLTPEDLLGKRKDDPQYFVMAAWGVAEGTCAGAPGAPKYVGGPCWCKVHVRPRTRGEDGLLYSKGEGCVEVDSFRKVRDPVPNEARRTGLTSVASGGKKTQAVVSETHLWIDRCMTFEELAVIEPGIRKLRHEFDEGDVSGEEHLRSWLRLREPFWFHRLFLICPEETIVTFWWTKTRERMIGQSMEVPDSFRWVQMPRAVGDPIKKDGPEKEKELDAGILDFRDGGYIWVCAYYRAPTLQEIERRNGKDSGSRKIGDQTVENEIILKTLHADVREIKVNTSPLLGAIGDVAKDVKTALQHVRGVPFLQAELAEARVVPDALAVEIHNRLADILTPKEQAIWHAMRRAAGSQKLALPSLRKAGVVSSAPTLSRRVGEINEKLILNNLTPCDAPAPPVRFNQSGGDENEEGKTSPEELSPVERDWAHDPADRDTTIQAYLTARPEDKAYFHETKPGIEEEAKKYLKRRPVKSD